MKKNIAVLLLGLSFSINVSAEHILQCMRPVFLDDPTFIQGSELFFDIYLDESAGVEVILTKGTLEKEVFLDEGIEKHFHLDVKERTFYAEWESPSNITLVLRQIGNRWMGGFWFSDGLKTSLVNILSGRDIDLHCVERGRLK